MEALCSETQLQEAGIQDDGPRQGPWGPNEAANSGGDQDVKNEGRRQDEFESRMEIKQDTKDKRYERMRKRAM